VSVLSRAPQEVYRVYDEPEFLASQLAGNIDPSHRMGDRAPRRARLLAPVLLALTALFVGLLSITELGSPTRRSRGRVGDSRLPAGSRSQSGVTSTRPVERSGSKQAAAKIANVATYLRPARRSSAADHPRRAESHLSARRETPVISAGVSAATTQTTPQPPEFGFEQGGSG
jgi:hypothetical protein